MSDLSKEKTLADFTVVSTFNQVQGRGQHGKFWFSDKDKNLSFSVFKRFNGLRTEQLALVNWQSALAVLDFMKLVNMPDPRVKWPNDILSGKMKVAGILIEPKIGNSFVKSAIIGIGINVNQDVFPVELSSATSIKIISSEPRALNQSLEEVLNCFGERFNNPDAWNFEAIKHEYESNMFNLDKVMVFQDLETKKRFNAMVLGVEDDNRLKIQLENEETLSVEMNRLKWLY